jgi:hypothetical protein
MCSPPLITHIHPARQAGGSSHGCQEQLCDHDPVRHWTWGANSNYTGCGTCWCCTPAGSAPNLPRLPNINYDPGVFVMLREVNVTTSSNTTRYFYASNSSTIELGGGRAAGAAVFYAALLAVQVICVPCTQITVISLTRAHTLRSLVPTRALRLT